MPPSPSTSSRAARSYAIEDELSAYAMPTMCSPLPAGYFGTVQISASKRQEFSEIVHRRVNSMLADEYRYTERRAQQHPVVQETEWKFFRRIGDMKVYQRRLRGRSRQEVAAEEEFPEAAIAVERGNPSMLANGSVSGTIEDMLYGASGTTQKEMITGLSFTAPPQDAVLLSVLKKSTVKDPLHSAEILWVLTKMPILNPRDVCYLKATGVGRDGNGNRYGYLVLHSVELPECPPFDYRKTKILRAKLFFSFMFREVTPGYVDVMGRGIFDLAGGELLKLVLPHATTSVMNGLLRCASCGEAKKLTLLAMRNNDERRQFKALTKKSVCSMCIRGNKRVLTGVRLKSCDVCGVPICKNCKIKGKRMFIGTKQPSREVVCCASCSQQAKCITDVCFGEPEFIVVAEYYSKTRPTSSSSAVAATLSTRSLEASARQAQQDTVARSYEAGKSEPTSLLSDAGKSVAVTNSTIDDSCAGFDLDMSFSGTLSDLNSVNSNAYRKDDDDLEEEPEPLSAELLKEYAELSDVTEETVSSGMKAWGDNYNGGTKLSTYDNNVCTSKRRPNNMFEWMMELQSSAEEAYITAKANEEIMKKSMRLTRLNSCAGFGSFDSTLVYGASRLPYRGTRELQCYVISRHLGVPFPLSWQSFDLTKCRSLANSQSQRDVLNQMSPSPRPAENWVSYAAPQPELRPVGVPLSPGCFQATDADRRRYTTLIRGRVDSLLRDEARYTERRARNDSFLHAGEWKQVKKEKDLTFYRRFQRGRSLRELALEEELPEIQRAVERGYTSMICDGFVKGTIEDMMYGMTASCQDDLMTGFSYKDPPKDCVWLGTVENATREDPFHTADLIWTLPKLPPVLDQVDVCYLKATGVEVDAKGERYGYLVLHGVHIAQCPPFAAHGIPRAKMYFACLFREPRPGVLKVTVCGIFDLSKKVRMLKGLVSAATTSIMVGLLNGVGIGEAKKLTLLARRDRSRLRNLDIQKQSMCYMCCKRASFFGLFGTHLVTCYVCGGTVCSHCTGATKQRVFLGTNQPCMKVDCCPNCVREAVTTIHVRSAEPEFVIVAEFYLSQRSLVLPEIHAELPRNEDESVGEYQLDFEDDPFSIALTLADHRRSSGEDNNELDSSPEPESDTLSSGIKPWRHRISIDDDDLFPTTAADRLYNVLQMERRLLALNIQAEQTYAQTQETTMSMQRERR